MLWGMMLCVNDSTVSYIIFMILFSLVHSTFIFKNVIIVLENILDSR